MFLKPLEMLFWLLGALLGASWGDLEPSWSEIEVILGDFGCTSNCFLFFGPILGAKRMPQGRHLGGQNGAKTDPKSRCKFKSEKITSSSRLGTIFIRFPWRLGIKNIDVSCLF